MFNKIYNRDLNTHDLWKLFAISLMFIDHLGLYIFNTNLTLRVLGRLSFPIFAIIYGYHFKDKLNFKLLIFGLPLIILNYCFYNSIYLNILYSFFIGGFFLSLYNKLDNNGNNKYIKYILLIVLIFLYKLFSILFEYGLFSFFFMLASNQKNKKQKIITFILVFLVYYITQCIHFSFNAQKSILFLLTLSIEGFFLYNYKLKTISNKNNVMNTYIKLLARYSMEIYFIQAICFEIYFYLFIYKQQIS